jgi:hypothetical protein
MSNKKIENFLFSKSTFIGRIIREFSKFDSRLFIIRVNSMFNFGVIGFNIRVVLIAICCFSISLSSSERTVLILLEELVVLTE